MQLCSDFPLPLEDLLLLGLVRVVLEDGLEDDDHGRVQGAALRLQHELDVTQRRDDDDLPAAVVVVLDALDRELEHVGQDPRHRGVLVVGQEDLLAEGKRRRQLASTELGHPGERLQLVTQLRLHTHRLRAHQLDHCAPSEELLDLDLQVLLAIIAED